MGLPFTNFAESVSFTILKMGPGLQKVVRVNPDNPP